MCCIDFLKASFNIYTRYYTGESWEKTKHEKKLNPTVCVFCF